MSVTRAMTAKELTVRYRFRRLVPTKRVDLRDSRPRTHLPNHPGGSALGALPVPSRCARGFAAPAVLKLPCLQPRVGGVRARERSVTYTTAFIPIPHTAYPKTRVSHQFEHYGLGGHSSFKAGRARRTGSDVFAASSRPALRRLSVAGTRVAC